MTPKEKKYTKLCVQIARLKGYETNCRNHAGILFIRKSQDDDWERAPDWESELNAAEGLLKETGLSWDIDYMSPGDPDSRPGFKRYTVRIFTYEDDYPTGRDDNLKLAICKAWIKCKEGEITPDAAQEHKSIR